MKEQQAGEVKNYTQCCIVETDVAEEVGATVGGFCWWPYQPGGSSIQILQFGVAGFPQWV